MSLVVHSTAVDIIVCCYLVYKVLCLTGIDKSFYIVAVKLWWECITHSHACYKQIWSGVETWSVHTRCSVTVQSRLHYMAVKNQSQNS